MDYSTQEGMRLQRVVQALWAQEPQNLLVEAYQHDRGNAASDFCTDFEVIAEVIEASRGKLDRMEKILDGIAELDGTSILGLFQARYPEKDLWQSALLDVTQMLDAEAEEDSWVCPGCNDPIVEGQHFMTTTIRLGTRMHPGYQPVREVPDTELQVRVHTPNCLVPWMANCELLTNVFG